MPAPSVSFGHGVASGDPYTTSVILWTRVTPPAGTTDPIDVSWEIATSADFARGSIKASGSFTTSVARDWTVKVEAAGLSADTSYSYRFRSGTTVSTVGQTKTLPVNSDPVRLAVFSCSNFPASERFDAYARAVAINSTNPYDAWLHLGDYIYEYGPGGYGSAEAAAGSRGFSPNREILSLDDYRQRYAQYHTDAGLQALRAAAPLIAIWDDHETTNDSWKDGAENHQSATEGDWITRRDAALKAYYEWIPIREPGQRQPSDGVGASTPLTQGYRSFNFGDVLALHMLETRLTARDQQLKYPDAAAVQARIGAILADPAQVASYATRAGIAPPAGSDAIPAFANALAPLVTQELVVATVQQAWGDPSRDMIGDSQLVWLQQQLASSTAAWQVLGQQTLMQSMAVPAELLLDPSNPALLDKYAAPLQKLATGTSFANLSAAEQALFAEAGKIPYNLDAWDGYGAERETILQTVLALGKRLISLAGDTHNAWSGLLDTMSAASKPAGTVAGVEFATPGVTSPGLEKYLPGADAYIRAKYPAVDGLDGLFVGYVNGLQYADLNRRGFLDLTVSREQAVGSFQFLNGTAPVSGQPLWSSETVVSSASYGLSTTAEARPVITWQPGWRELDLNFGLAFDAGGAPTRLDPAAYASVPRAGVQLADVQVQGSDADDTVVLGVGSTVNTGAGNDLLDNSDSQGGNLLVGGSGRDEFLLRAADDRVIGAELLANASSLGLPAVVGLADDQRDVFLVDSSNPAPQGTLRILDYELGRDALLLDGIAPVGDWSSIRQRLQELGITMNATPQISSPLITITLQPGVEVSYDLAAAATDPDGDPLQLLKLAGPSWISTSGTSIKATAPADLNLQQLNDLDLRLAFSDGQAAIGFEPVLKLNAPPSALRLINATTSLEENTSTARRIQLAEIEISDDGLGSNSITILGPDADRFVVEGNKLFLQANTNLDFETQSRYSILVSASDAVLTSSPAVEAPFTLTLSDVNEIPGISDLSTVVTVDLPGGGSRQLAVTFRDGDLSPSSSLAILSSFNINPQTLTNLAELGVRPSGGGVDFQLQVAPGQNQSSLSSLIELVAADLLPDLSDAAGRRPARKLLYYALNGSSEVTRLTYDPITGAGARFFDLNNDGKADYFSLSLVDGGYGDKDGLENGVIDDPSFAGYVDLSALAFSSSSPGIVTIGDPGNAAPAAISLRASLSSRPDSSNQIGYVVLNASELASADSKLSDLNWLRGRARTLFSTLEQTDVTLPSGSTFERDIQLINGQSLRFFEVVDASLDQLTSLSDSRFRLLSPDPLASDRVTVAAASGSRFQLTLLAGDPGLNAMVAQAQALAPVLDLTPLTAAQNLQGTVRIAREAQFDSVVGFYRTLDAAGAVLAADGITRLRPQDDGYAAAALGATNVVTSLSNLAVADDQTSARTFAGIAGGSFLAPFAEVKGNTFFAYAAANSDGISHFRSLGNNRFGLEDIRGGGDRDFDDLIIAIDFTGVA